MQLKSFGETLENRGGQCRVLEWTEVVRDDEWSDITRNNVQRRALYFTFPPSRWLHRVYFASTFPRTISQVRQPSTVGPILFADDTWPSEILPFTMLPVVVVFTLPRQRKVYAVAARPLFAVTRLIYRHRIVVSHTRTTCACDDVFTLNNKWTIKNLEGNFLIFNSLLYRRV